MHVYVLFRVFMLLHHTTSLFWVKLRLRDTERGRTLRSGLSQISHLQYFAVLCSNENAARSYASGQQL